MQSRSTKYRSDWFQAHAEGSRRAAEAILPLVLESVPVGSALDIGCGVGGWLATLRTLGVEDVVGVDGDYVDRALLQFPPDRFTPLDLTVEFDLGRAFDLVLSVEVAEHLPMESADSFVASLVRHAPVVIFSAAIPGQGGIDHFNEQWPDYWAEKFERHGYLAVDAVRPRLWSDTAVDFWYVQNTILYISEAALPESLRRWTVEDLGNLCLVHPRQFAWSTRPRPHSKRRRLFLEAMIGFEATEGIRRYLGRFD